MMVDRVGMWTDRRTRTLATALGRRVVAVGLARRTPDTGRVVLVHKVPLGARSLRRRQRVTTSDRTNRSSRCSGPHSRYGQVVVLLRANLGTAIGRTGSDY